MRTCIHSFLCALLLFVGSAHSAFAHEPLDAASFKRSTIELRVNAGEIHAENDEFVAELDEVDTAHVAFGYWLNLNRNVALGVSYLEGESDDFDFTFFNLFEDTILEYDAVLVDVEGRVPLGRENYLFARAGVAFYDYEVIDDRDDQELTSDDGTDFHAALGWSKRWGNGVGMVAMYEYLSLGDDLDVNTIGVGITYSF